MQRIQIHKNDANQRLDRFLSKYLNKAPKSLIQKLIRKKRLRLNGGRPKADTILLEGDILELYIYDEALAKWRDDKPQKPFSASKLDIIYEDDQIIILNKPEGLLSHAASPEDYGRNLVDHLTAYLIAQGSYVSRLEQSFQPAIANRLDRNTSGLVLAAKNREALVCLNDQLKNRSIDRLYRTIVKGSFKGVRKIGLALEKDEAKNKVRIGQEGRAAQTVVRFKKDYGAFTEVEVDLITGRTHQIRVHLSSIGHPIIGDVKYGDPAINARLKRYGLHHQLLQAYAIQFGDMPEPLAYMSGKRFEAPKQALYQKIEQALLHQPGK